MYHIKLQDMFLCFVERLCIEKEDGQRHGLCRKIRKKTHKVVTVRQIPEGMSLYARSRVSILLACFGNKQGVASPIVTSACIELFTYIHTGSIRLDHEECALSFKEW